jgi:hypothetical protein
MRFLTAEQFLAACGIKELLQGLPQTKVHVIKVTRKINSIQGAIYIYICTQLLTNQQTTLLTPCNVLCPVSHCISSKALSFTTAVTNLPLTSSGIPGSGILGYITGKQRLFKL